MAGFPRRSRSLRRAAPRATTVALAIVTALAVACEGAPAVLPSGAGGTGGVPAAGWLADADIRYGCGEFGFDPSILGEPGNAEQGDDPIAVALRAPSRCLGWTSRSCPTRAGCSWETTIDGRSSSHGTTEEP